MNEYNCPACPFSIESQSFLAFVDCENTDCRVDSFRTQR